jgi:uncharacterized protein (TIGR00730 family)
LVKTDSIRSFHQRKALMADRADAFLALPGGFGTADELFEILTWAQLGLHGKPVGVLNVAGFFDPLLAWLDRAAHDGFLAEEHRGLLLVGDEPGPLLDRLASSPPPPPVGKWVDPSER